MQTSAPFQIFSITLGVEQLSINVIFVLGDHCRIESTLKSSSAGNLPEMKLHSLNDGKQILV